MVLSLDGYDFGMFAGTLILAFIVITFCKIIIIRTLGQAKSTYLAYILAPAIITLIAAFGLYDTREPEWKSAFFTYLPAILAFLATDILRSNLSGEKTKLKNVITFIVCVLFVATPSHFVIKGMKLDNTSTNISKDKFFADAAQEGIDELKAKNSFQGQPQNMEQYEEQLENAKNFVVEMAQDGAKDEIAGVFFGYSARWTYGYEQHCSKYKVGIPKLIKAFHKKHDEIKEKILAHTNVGKISKDPTKEIYLSMSEILANDVKNEFDVSKKDSGLSDAEICTNINVIAEDLIESMNFETMFPEVYQQIMSW